MARGHKRSCTSVDSDDADHPRGYSPHGSKLGARSCKSCYERKVRCDRSLPCTNCSRSGRICAYPTPKNEGRKTATLQNVYDRLERLENLISCLVDKRQVPATLPPGDCDPVVGHDGEPPFQSQDQSVATINTLGPVNRYSLESGPFKSTWDLLLKDKEGPKFPNSGTTLQDLWNIFVKSVDPVLKILHIPTIQSTVIATIMDPRSAQSSTLALTFSIYYAAVTAISHDESSDSIGVSWDKPALLERYKTALDLLLTMTDLMKRPEIRLLQALAIYTNCLRAHEIGPSVWVLNGLAIRLAQSIGLHRHDHFLQLSPFESEMRLRLWWHLCVLDSRAPEDHGFQPTVDLVNRGLRLPLNVNDNQLYPEMTSLPAQSRGWTEMSFFLIQTESCRLIHPMLDSGDQNPADALLEIREKRKNIQDPYQYLSAKYDLSSGSEVQNNLLRITTQHITTACRKMEFVLQLREEIIVRKQTNAQDDTTPEVLRLSFQLACDALESSYLLLKEDLASRFKWFFSMYTQWYALAYVLRCLAASPGAIGTERAWMLVEELFPSRMSRQEPPIGADDDYAHGSIWRWLYLLRHQALLVRKKDARMTVANSAVLVENSSGGKDYTSQSLVDPRISSRIDTMGKSDKPTSISEVGQGLMDTSFQNTVPFLDMPIPEVSFLPDWNAILNDCFCDDVYEMNSSCLPP
ncbi:hypothetical protein N7456_001330 [Penicillium angulare]|uniref:Zn(2)-C6 fungal-type domain-containing protein n=1 Tax=Penicillium angulare TaxID=116970 RepID=A0A9W9GDX4_9EURO|nr:hypothetical protein N7456_001330 [Penicillium angulare]